MRVGSTSLSLLQVRVGFFSVVAQSIQPSVTETSVLELGQISRNGLLAKVNIALQHEANK
jgi:hypothetical protein